ncbi:hypothetical protein LTR09_011332 [Extremus antarcticus]|uniref:F-box domain-containing protein n=1 Tax=Extremus antarcticus TaxID=702011 RepID=A0AAJ0G520_9PEZI|nr:hypothetical protein LTR09_011332 [Extremus antarcticus]
MANLFSGSHSRTYSEDVADNTHHNEDRTGPDEWVLPGPDAPTPTLPQRSVLGGLPEDVVWTQDAVLSPLPRDCRAKLPADQPSGSIEPLFYHISSDSEEGRPLSAAHRLPTEIVQEIYTYLAPRDFNAARRSCLGWLSASLDMQMLMEQVKRGGWWSRALSQRFESAWSLSSFLACECALAGAWTGNGLDVVKQDHCNPMVEGCSVDLEDPRHRAHSTIAVDVEGLKCRGRLSSGTPRQFNAYTISSCGRYFVTTVGPDIYLYDVKGLWFNLYGRVSCGRPVVAVALDTSDNKVIIAAILEGRICIYIDLVRSAVSELDVIWQISGTSNEPISDTSMERGFPDDVALNIRSRDINVGELDELSVNAGSVGESSMLHQSVELVTHRSWTHFYHGRRARLRGMRQMPAPTNGVWPRALAFDEDGDDQGAELQPHSRLVYRNVCTEDDPPESIAISPARQCVAFGCKSGVELYWVFYLSSSSSPPVHVTDREAVDRPIHRSESESLVPTSRPSDHLYFLPPRKHIDSGHSLRLISSTTHSTPTSEDRDAVTTRSSPNNLWFTLSSSWKFVPTRPATHAADHSQAIPLSDGHHLLFTDTHTGRLCLGSDAPASSVQRLSRKFVFSPLATISSSKTTLASPSIYAAAADLLDGVRIAAVYESDIVLYSVSVDVLRYSTAEQERTIQDPSVPFEELKWINLLQHPTSNAHTLSGEASDATRRFDRLNMAWVHYLPSAADGRVRTLDSLWPFHIPGTWIGKLDDVRTLAVQASSGDGLVVWAFSGSGVGKAWKVDDGRRPVESLRRGDGDGDDGVVR